jgi:hypothetical protein
MCSRIAPRFLITNVLCFPIGTDRRYSVEMPKSIEEANKQSAVIDQDRAKVTLLTAPATIDNDCVLERIEQTSQDIMAGHGFVNTPAGPCPFRSCSMVLTTEYECRKHIARMSES